MSTEPEARPNDPVQDDSPQSASGQPNATTTDEQESAAATATRTEEQAQAEKKDEEAEPSLDLVDIEIERLGACKRLIRVRVPAEEVDRILEYQLAIFAKKAELPGFRKGKVPPRLVLRKFRRELLEELKRLLVAQAVKKLVEDEELEFVDEPDLDIAALNPPSQGEDFYFEFRADVQPDFDLPSYKGLKVRRPRPEITPELVYARARELAEGTVEPEPVDDAVRRGDYIKATFQFRHDGQVIRTIESGMVRVLATLRFRDAVIERFDEQIAGLCPGQSRTLKARISENAANPDLRGKEVEVEVTLNRVYRYPENLIERLCELTGHEDEESLLAEVESLLRRELERTRQLRIREQVMGQLLEKVDIPLDKETIKGQIDVMRRRIVRERLMAGYTPDEIESALLRIDNRLPELTAKALREHFVLSRIAKAEDIRVQPEQVDDYLERLAEVQKTTARRLRVQLQREGVLGEIEGEILEHLAFQRVLDYCEIEDEEWEVRPEDLFPEEDIVTVEMETAPADEESSAGTQHTEESPRESQEGAPPATPEATDTAPPEGTSRTEP